MNENLRAVFLVIIVILITMFFYNRDPGMKLDKMHSNGEFRVVDGVLYIK